MEQTLEKLRLEIEALDIELRDANDYVKQLYATKKRIEDKIAEKKSELLDILKTSYKEDGVLSHKYNNTLYSLRKKPRSVVIKGDVPKEYMKVVTTPNKTAIRDFLKHNDVEWAELSEEDFTVAITWTKDDIVNAGLEEQKEQQIYGACNNGK